MHSTARRSLQRCCRIAFQATLLLFLTLAGALVVTQVAGVLLLQPDWITAAKDTLLVPSIAAAVAFGLVGFLSSYLTAGTTEEPPSNEPSATSADPN